MSVDVDVDVDAEHASRNLPDYYRTCAIVRRNRFRMYAPLNLQQKRHQKTKRWTSWLFVIMALLVSSTLAPSVASAQSQEVTQFGPSSYLPSLHNNACSGKRPESNPFGVQMYGVISTLKQHNALQDSYSSYLRTSIEWGKVETSNVDPSQYDWAPADANVRMGLNNCVHLIATIDTTPAWATIGDARSPFQTDLLPEFVQFMQAAVERYDGDGVDDAPDGLVVKYFELWNEPDAGGSPSGGGWGDYGERYGEMLKAIYPVVKAANPNAQVVIGGLAYDFFTDRPGGDGIFVRGFIDNVLATGAGDSIDYMNVHYYPFVRHREEWTAGNSSGLIEKIDALKAKMAEYGVNKPLMVTEVGWHSNPIDSNPSNEDYQGRHIIQLMTQSIAEGAAVVIWWPLFDQPDYQFKSGLATGEGNLKASHKVFVEANKRIGAGEFVQVVLPSSETENLEVYEFREAGTNKTFYVAWLNPIAPFNAAAVPTFDDTVTQTWQAPGTTARVFTKEGNLKQVVQDNSDGTVDGRINIVVGRNPIYIVID